MHYKIGLNLVFEKLKQEQENKLWDQWISLYPKMTEETFVTFSEFKEKAKPKKKLTNEEKRKIDKKVINIKKAYRKKVSK